MPATLSDIFTNSTASPVVMNAPQLGGARMRSAVATIVLVGDESTANSDVLPLIRIGWETVIHGLWFANESAGTTMTLDVGLWESEEWTTTSTGTKKDAEIYADGLNVATASSIPEQALGSGTNAVNGDEIWRPAYLDAGDTAASHDDTYDLCAEVVTGATITAAAEIKFLIHYCA